MNDFTKEELQELHYVLAHYSNHHFTKPENVTLENKIKSMIQNYCQHSYGICYEGEQAKPICLKCRRKVFP